MADKAKNDDTQAPRRSRRVASAPQNVLATCIAELERLDHDERERVLRSIMAWFSGKAALPTLPVEGAEVGGGRFA